MNIKEIQQKIKSFCRKDEESSSLANDVFIILLVLFVAVISFGLGRLSALSDKKEPIMVENLQSNLVSSVKSGEGEETVEKSFDVNKNDKLYVASKKGTKYHYPWCSGAQRIKEENKIWFSTKEEAERAGYGPAGNCKGL